VSAAFVTVIEAFGDLRLNQSLLAPRSICLSLVTDTFLSPRAAYVGIRRQSAAAFALQSRRGLKIFASLGKTIAEDFFLAFLPKRAELISCLVPATRADEGSSEATRNIFQRDRCLATRNRSVAVTYRMHETSPALPETATQISSQKRHSHRRSRSAANNE
jgi:hypothetical protein